MARVVRCALVQVGSDLPMDRPVDEIKAALNDKCARLIDGGGRAGGAQVAGAARALQHALLRGGHRPALVRRRGARPRRPHDRADAGAGPAARDGHRGAALRAGRRRPVQLRGRRRRRRARSWASIGSTTCPDPHAGQLRALLLPPARRGIPGLRHGVRPPRHLHLLRPALPGDRAHLRGQGRRDRLQSLGDRRPPVRAGVGARAAGPRAGQRLLRRRPEPGRRGRRTTARSSSARATSATRWARSSPRRGGASRRS